MERKQMLHHLRNPYGIDEVEMRKARLQAADELERLYKIEEMFYNMEDRITAIIHKIEGSDEVIYNHPV